MRRVTTVLSDILRRRGSRGRHGDDTKHALTDGSRIEVLEQRVRHLEVLIEGLQDSVYRESVRREEQIRGLQQKTEPGEMSRAINRDARKRGI